MFMQVVSVATDTVLTSRLKRGPGKEMKKARDSHPSGGDLLEAYASCRGASVCLLGVENSGTEGSLFHTQTYTTT